jgi:hypothetical protein
MGHATAFLVIAAVCPEVYMLYPNFIVAQLYITYGTVMSELSS